MSIIRFLSYKYLNIRESAETFPIAVDRRLCAISSSKDIFDGIAPVNPTQLNRAGYDHTFEFFEFGENRTRRQRKVIWVKSSSCGLTKTSELTKESRPMCDLQLRNSKGTKSTSWTSPTQHTKTQQQFQLIYGNTSLFVVTLPNVQPSPHPKKFDVVV